MNTKTGGCVQNATIIVDQSLERILLDVPRLWQTTEWTQCAE